MSALTDLFTSMANKIRSKTGTATTYTPSEMASDGIDDVFDAGVASATTSITPSNSSPAAMTANTGYKPTSAGYAIESYSSITPLNSSPATITSGTIYKASANGKAVASVTDITPSSSAPPMSNGSIYKAGAAGYAIDSYQIKTPSTSGAAFNAGFVKMSSAGLAYSEVPTISTYALVESSITPNTRVSGFSMESSSYAIGKKYLVLLFDARTSAQAYDKMDNANGYSVTLTKLCNLMNANAPVCGTFYIAQKMTSSAVISFPNQGYYMVFEAQ